MAIGPATRCDEATLVPSLVYGGCGFAVFQSCDCQHKWKLVVRFSIGLYESKTLFSLLFCKYWS